MGKILQLLLRWNIIPGWWKFWMSKAFRIWCNSNNFGTDSLRNMTLYWQRFVTQDAPTEQSHIIPATFCHWLHSQKKECSKQWPKEQTEPLPLWSGSAEVVFSPISISAFLSLVSTWERLGMKNLFLSKAGVLHCRRAYGQLSEQYLHLQDLSYTCVQMRSS